MLLLLLLDVAALEPLHQQQLQVTCLTGQTMSSRAQLALMRAAESPDQTCCVASALAAACCRACAM